MVRGVIKQEVYAGAVTACMARTLGFTPVVYTCGVSVLQDLRRTMAVLTGSQRIVSTQNHGSEKAGVGGSTPSLATTFSIT